MTYFYANLAAPPHSWWSPTRGMSSSHRTPKILIDCLRGKVRRYLERHRGSDLNSGVSKSLMRNGPSRSPSIECPSRGFRRAWMASAATCALLQASAATSILARISDEQSEAFSLSTLAETQLLSSGASNLRTTRTGFGGSEWGKMVASISLQRTQCAPRLFQEFDHD